MEPFCNIAICIKRHKKRETSETRVRQQCLGCCLTLVLLYPAVYIYIRTRRQVCRLDSFPKRTDGSAAPRRRRGKRAAMPARVPQKGPFFRQSFVLHRAPAARFAPFLKRVRGAAVGRSACHADSDRFHGQKLAETEPCRLSIRA